jgi:Na+/H+ antiporter NhaD/arsenite permease-like protein
MNWALLGALGAVYWPDGLIFAATYIGLALGAIPGTRLDRTGIAVLGAVAVLLARRMSFDNALAQVNFPTLFLLVSMMIISAQLRLAGFYEWVVRRMVAMAHRPTQLLGGVIFSSALLSALFANDVICLIFTPVICVALYRAGRDPIPYLMALVTASNIGSAATVIGNPQIILIGQTAHLAFGAYSLTVVPLVVVCLILNYAAIRVVYHRRLWAPAEPPPVPIGSLQQPGVAQQWDMIIKALVIMGLLLLAMIFGDALNLPREIAAMAAAGLILISRKTNTKDLFALVDWNLIMLFIGLFIVIGDAQQNHLIQPIFQGLQRAGISLNSHLSLAGVVLVLGNIVSNVPAVLLIKPVIAPLAVTNTWYLLAVVSTFAGNLTLLGSIANLIVAQQAETCSVRLAFTEYLKAGVPLTLLCTALAILYFHWI